MKGSAIRLANKSLFATFALSLYCIVETVLCQSQCFVGDLGNRFVYSQDVISYDLSAVSEGSNVNFKLDSAASSFAELEETFGSFEKPTRLNKNVSACTKYTHINNTHYAYLCDGSDVIFAVYNPITGDLVKQSIVSIDSKYTCQSISSSKVKGVAYVVCLQASPLEGKPPTLYIAVVDPVLESVSGFVDIPQSGDEVIKNNLVCQTLTESTEGSADNVVLLYVYEDIENTGADFRVFRHSGAGIQNGGFYSSKSASITGIDEKSTFYGIRAVGQTLVLVMRYSDKDKFIYLQKCNPSPIMSKIQCDSTQRASFGVSMELFVLNFHKIDSSDGSSLYTTVLADNNRLILFNFNNINVKDGLSQLNDVDIKGNSLANLKDAFAWGERAYLVGLTAKDQNAILRFDTRSGNWQEKIFSDPTYTISFIRRGTYDTDVDEHIAIAGRTSYFSLIFRAQLVLYPSKAGSANKITAKVNCYIGTTLVNSRTVELNILKEINDAGEFDVPDKIEAYATSKVITVPICNDDVLANAPVFNITTVSSPSKQTVPFRVEYLNPAFDTEYKGDTFKNIDAFYYVGEDMYVMTSPTYLAFMYCYSTSDLRSYCELKGKTLNSKTILDSILSGPNILTLEYNNAVSGQKLEQVPTKLFLTVRDRNDPGKVVSSLSFPGLVVDVAEMRVWGGSIYALIVATNSSISKYLYRVEIDQNTWKVKSMMTLIKIDAHMCIKEIKFAPHSDTSVYLSSHCDGDINTARIYEVFISSWGGKVTANINKIYAGHFQSTDFFICPTKSGMGIIDKSGNVSLLDIGQNEDTRFTYPTKEYGVEKIQLFHCDQENGIFQIVGSDKAESQFWLVTYHSEGQLDPRDRVHSVRKLGNERPSYISSTMNYNKDLVNTVLIGQSTDMMNQVRIYTGAPYIELDASAITEPGEYKLQYTMTPTGPNSDKKIVSKTQTLVLSPVDYSVKITPKTSDNSKITIPQKVMLPLDDSLNVQGPVVKIDLVNAGHNAILYDRLHQSDQLKNLTGVAFTQIAIDRDLVLGLTANQKLILYQNSAEIMSTDKFTVESLGYLGGGQGFFALATPKNGIDKCIVAFLFIDNKWNVYSFSLSSRYVQDMVFFPIAGGTEGVKNVALFGFAAVDNEKNNIQVGVLQAVSGSLSFKSQQLIENKDLVNDFSAVVIPKDQNTEYVFVVSSEVRSKQGKFTLFRIRAGQIEYVGQNIDSLIPDVKAIHNQVDFACVRVTNSSNQVDCLHTELNKYSYLVRYTINLDTQDMTKLVQSTTRRRFNNLPNMKAIRSDYFEGFGAVVVENLAVQKTKTTDEILGQKYLMLIYNADYQDDVFKVMRPVDLGLKSAEDLMDLEPEFFLPSATSQVKLGINVGVADTPIRVFNLDSMRMLVNDRESITSTTALEVTRLDGVKTQIKILDLCKIEDPTPSNKKSKGVQIALYVSIVALCLAAIAGIVIIYLYKTGKLGSSAEAYKQGDGFDTEHTIKVDDSVHSTPLDARHRQGMN
jgi:hypothetical protein